MQTARQALDQENKSRRFGDLVDRTRSPSDGMFAGDEHHYFSVGRSGLLNIKRALRCASGHFGAPGQILDFPCGHGRVLRYLRAEFPHAEITACDLLEDGVDFCAATFGAIPVYSDPDPARIALPRDAFDLIWVGSLFTHLDAARWSKFVLFFRSLLRPSGLLVFSTHGRRSCEILTEHPEAYALDLRRRDRILKQYNRTGFGYSDYGNQTEYGVSIAEPAWVCRLITSIPDLRLVGLNEKSWDDHHDVYACARDVSSAAKPAPGKSSRPHFGRHA